MSSFQFLLHISCLFYGLFIAVWMVWARHLCDACVLPNEKHTKNYTTSATSFFFFVAPSHCHFTISIFEQWAKSSRSPILWISNGCESCSVWGFSSHLMLTINRLAIIQMRVNCRSNQILIYVKWHSNAVINETKKFFMFFQLRQTAGDCFPLLN